MWKFERKKKVFPTHYFPLKNNRLCYANFHSSFIFITTKKKARSSAIHQTHPKALVLSLQDRPSLHITFTQWFRRQQIEARVSIATIVHLQQTMGHHHPHPPPHLRRRPFLRAQQHLCMTVIAYWKYGGSWALSFSSDRTQIQMLAIVCVHSCSRLPWVSINARDFQLFDFSIYRAADYQSKNFKLLFRRQQIFHYDQMFYHSCALICHCCSARLTAWLVSVSLVCRPSSTCEQMKARY